MAITDKPRTPRKSGVKSAKKIAEQMGLVGPIRPGQVVQIGGPGMPSAGGPGFVGGPGGVSRVGEFATQGLTGRNAIPMGNAFTPNTLGALPAGTSGGAVQPFGGGSPSTVNVGQARYASGQAQAARAAAGTRGASTIVGGAGQTAARAAATVADDVAQAGAQTAQGGRLMNLLTTQPRTLLGGAPAQAGAAGGRAWLAPGTLGRGLGYGAAGQVVGGVLDSAIGEQDGTWDDALGSAARWGGAGAGIGSMIAPGIGTAIGGGIGAVIGGTKGWLTGDDSPGTEAGRELEDRTAELSTIFQQYSLTSETANTLMAQLSILGSQAGSPDEVKMIFDQVLAQVPQLIQQDAIARERNNRVAATQAWLMPLLEAEMGKSDEYAREAGAAYQSAASYVQDPQLKAIYNKQASQLSLQNSRDNMNQLTMLQLTPSLYGYMTPEAGAYPQATPTSGDLDSILNAQLTGL